MLTIENIKNIEGLFYNGWLVAEADETILESDGVYRFVFISPDSQIIGVNLLRYLTNGKYWITAEPLWITKPNYPKALVMEQKYIGTTELFTKWIIGQIEDEVWE